MLTLADSWVWDFWLADDGETFHVYFLHAPRSLGDPDLRHVNARIGHATSTDLTTWTQHPDALQPGAPGSVDDVATWTGSVVRDPSGGWRMFYTGLAHHGAGHVQRITSATSQDLITWQKDASFTLAPDGHWYAIGADVAAGDETGDTWRDPWVFPDPTGHGWYMFITARAAAGPTGDDGVVGQAWSPDLLNWTLRPPLSAPGAGFQHLEVFQAEIVDGRAVLLFSCLPGQTTQSRRQRDGAAGTWALAADDLLGPFDTTAARPLTDNRFYSARLIRNRSGQWVLLAFLDEGPNGFVGALSDPMPVQWSGDDLTLTPELGLSSDQTNEPVSNSF